MRAGSYLWLLRNAAFPVVAGTCACADTSQLRAHLNAISEDLEEGMQCSEGVLWAPVGRIAFLNGNDIMSLFLFNLFCVSLKIERND
jgi:hypothetical protein